MLIEDQMFLYNIEHMYMSDYTNILVAILM